MIYILPPEALAFLPSDIALRVKEQCREGSKACFPLDSLYATGDAKSDAACTRVAAQAQYRILRFLLESPAFTKYMHCDDPLLAAPLPTKLLPCGAEHITKQHILQTVEVDESTYDGTDRLCNNIWLKQMGFTEEDLREIIEGRVQEILVWVGDQLTVERIRGLIRYRYDDINSVEQMDFYEPHFGWFHVTMAFANSLHMQYLGTLAGIGLRKAFEMLGRKGLMKQETKGVFFHHLDEALWHVGEAHFLSLWMEVGKVDDLSKLITETPIELVDLLEKIITEHASLVAVHKLAMLPPDQCDNVKQQTIMFATDILPYFNLREAMQVGNVG